LLTCEPVLTEAAFLLKREGRDTDALFAFFERGVIRIALAVEKQQADLRVLMRRYRNRPMLLADARTVRALEIHGVAEVLTLDRLKGPFRHFDSAPTALSLPNPSDLSCASSSACMGSDDTDDSHLCPGHHLSARNSRLSRAGSARKT
jgi:predicted nucleic acid-binding protein